MTYLLDANILVRFLVDDGNVHSPAVRKLIRDAQLGKVSLQGPFIAITECVFVLESFYELDRAEIGRELLKLLNAQGLTLTCPAWVLAALEDYRDKNVSFGDACMAAEALSRQMTIASYDKGFAKFPAVKRFEPKV
jgi:predicted nucleic acid-binding protein